MNATITKIETKQRAASKPKAQTKRKAVSNGRQINKFLTHTMGWGMPLLSIALAQVAGVLFLQGFSLLMWFAMIPMIAVLCVSLEHVAWSIRDITKSPKAGAWSLAIAFDLSIILGEICYVSVEDLRIVGMALMVALGALSGALNVHAFFFQGKRK